MTIIKRNNYYNSEYSKSMNGRVGGGGIMPGFLKPDQKTSHGLLHCICASYKKASLSTQSSSL